MTRSVMHTPIISWCGHHSCKVWRTQENRRYRAYAKNLMRHAQYDSIQGYCGKFGNEWDSPRDGKYWYTRGKGKKCNTTIWYSSYLTGILGIIPTCENGDHWSCDIAYKKQMRR